MTKTSAIENLLSDLNPQQRAAAMHSDTPLLIVAGAGTGKTATLVHRVAWLIANGVDPSRILLLTFTRRAAAEMIRRVDGVLAELRRSRTSAGEQPLRSTRAWGGTFHAIATRLLRKYGKAIGLTAEFSIHDRGDSEDLMNVVRTELGLAKNDRRFPKKGTCMDIYSHCVNARKKLSQILATQFPWCKEWADELKQLFDAYVDRKESTQSLDYDDLLVYWHAVLSDSEAGEAIRKQFDYVLVDEYQDTNALQAEILHQLRPEGKGLTVVGDDAQSIYSFRAATVRNILDFPKQYPNTTVIPLEQNYRSTQPILDATNAVIALSHERFTKNLWCERKEGERPWLVTCESEEEQTDFVVRQILEHREAGVDLRRQAVLFRASHHSMLLEAELARRNIPFYKYGGLKFIETAHVKDLLAFLRLADNPRDVVSGLRLLALLPGIGPRKAHQLMGTLLEAGGSYDVWRAWKPPASAAKLWPKLISLLENLAQSKQDLTSQVHQVRTFYSPLLEELYDNPRPRARDLEQLEQIASRYKDRRTMLADITLDPPASTQDLAGPPLLDEDYLILSTIHSAKGLEWDVVYVIHASDGNIPSDMATGTPEGVEEERRLFYVSLTRARNSLYVCFPLRYYHYQGSFGDRYGYAQLTRFLADGPVDQFQRVTTSLEAEADEETDVASDITSESIRRRTKDLWS
ncbi:MAG: ATP-dependent helicase [Thermoguttaceae bacterium]|jgi:DNA helicase-2/ATP-dependent DNA helicase PcrA